MITYRIVKVSKDSTRLYQIVDGSVCELVPRDEDKKREPGYYDADFNLIKREYPPWETGGEK